MHSPTHLFVIPGAVMAVLGTLISLTVLLQINVLGRAWDLHTMVAGALLMIVGTQVVGARALRARLRHLLHGGAATPGSTGCAPATGSSTGWCSAASLILAGLVIAR